MASITMTASILGGATLASWSPVATQRRLIVANAARVEGQNMQVSYDTDNEGSNGRRNLMFSAAAAALCSAAGMAAAEEEPKPGAPEAKKIYAPVCVTMPTARICHK